MFVHLYQYEWKMTMIIFVSCHQSATVQSVTQKNKCEPTTASVSVPNVCCGMQKECEIVWKITKDYYVAQLINYTNNGLDTLLKEEKTHAKIMFHLMIWWGKIDSIFLHTRTHTHPCSDPLPLFFLCDVLIKMRELSMNSGKISMRWNVFVMNNKINE